MRLVLSFAISLLFIPAQIALGSPVSPTDCADAGTLKRDVLMTSIFVDSFGVDSAATTVLATNDGGAIFASRRIDNSSPRVVKVDADGRFQWYSEQRVSVGDTASTQYYPYAAVEDPDGTSIYVAGYSSDGSAYAGFIIKYKMTDGSCLGSNSILLEVSTKVFALLFDSDGDLVFGGYCLGSDTFYYAAAGIIDKSGLTVTIGTVISAAIQDMYIYRIVEDPVGNYVYAAQSIPDNCLRIGQLSKSTLTQLWDFHTTTACSAVGSLITLSSGSTYGVICDGNYYVATSASSISAGLIFTGSSAMVTLQDAGMVMILGGDASQYTFAYEFNTAASCSYLQGAGAKYYPFKFLSASRYSSYGYVWTTAVSMSDAPYGFVAKVHEVTALSCGGLYNYLNRACLPIISLGCYGLCATCVLPNNLNACRAPQAAAHQNLIQVYAGRCSTSGYHYDFALTSCNIILQSPLCHKLCGGECLALGDNTRCAHHCISRVIEPKVDELRLYQSTCRCKLGYAFNAANDRCEIVTGCHISCGTGGCVVPGDCAQCVNCAAGITTNAISGAEYVACCGAGTIFTAGVCAPCHVFCSGCIVANDRQQCNACSGTVVNLQGTGASPVSCDCVAGTVYDSFSGNCVYTTGCHPLCLNGKCTVQSSNSACAGCHPSAAAVLVSSGVYQCTCPSGTLNNVTNCLPIFTSGCYPLCGFSGCTALNDPAACLSCASHLNVVSSATATTSVRNCSCAVGTQYITENAICAYSSGCSLHCDLCYMQNNASACVACATGISPAFGVDPTLVTCECPTETAIYYNESCVPVVSKTCHPLCGPSGCIEPARQDMCISSCASSAIAGVTVGEIVSCACPNGTRLNSAAGCVLDVTCDPLCASCRDQDVCASCPQGVEGMVLSYGKCICAVLEGYIMVQDQGTYSCIQKITTAATAVQYTGYACKLCIVSNRSTIVATIMVSAVVFPAGSCNLGS